MIDTGNFRGWDDQDNVFKFPPYSTDDADSPASVRISVLSLFKDCVTAFENLQDKLGNALSRPHLPLDVDNSNFHLLARKLEDDFGRFRAWAGSCGAHRTGKVSLDHKLREAINVHDMVTRLLRDLKNALEEARICIRNEFKVNKSSSLSSVELDGESQASEASSDCSISSISISDSELQGDDVDERALTDSDFAFMDISHIIGCLYKFSVTLRQPALRDRIQKCAKIDVSHYEFWDIKHASEKFPMAPDYLIQRLGKANVKRRQLLLYHKKHHDKITGYINTAADNSRSKEAHDILPSTTPVPLEQRDVKFEFTENRYPDANILFGGRPETQHQSVDESRAPETLIESYLSQTTVTAFNPEALRSEIKGKSVYEDGESDGEKSVTSYAMSDRSTSDTTYRLHAPMCPVDTSDNPFQCPYCFDIISLENTNISWMNHIFQDLRPYVCTFQDCHKADYLFESRSEWFQHEAQFHRLEWFCASKKCTKAPIFGTRKDFIAHLRNDHDDCDADSHDPSAMAYRCQRPIESGQICVICQILPNEMKGPILYSPVNLRRHLGQHMQQLALFVLSNGPGHVHEFDSEDIEERSNGTRDLKELGQFSEFGTPTKLSSSASNKGHGVASLVTISSSLDLDPYESDTSSVAMASGRLASGRYGQSYGQSYSRVQSYSRGRRLLGRTSSGIEPRNEFFDEMPPGGNVDLDQP
ncbi:hypothetical protein DFH27DRAFT_580291 [Peziza echinospora]|nr:hypothetical protein DFH27DRAFT_580291 [Peziza echinospora]